jgi:hypothetical protein
MVSYLAENKSELLAIRMPLSLVARRDDMIILLPNLRRPGFVGSFLSGFHERSGF